MRFRCSATHCCTISDLPRPASPVNKGDPLKIIAIILYQGSKLSLVNQYKNTGLRELSGHTYGIRSDVDKHCYKPMDELLKRKRKIEKKHLQNGCILLYDMTNTRVEGEYENSQKITYGKPKGGKYGYKQIALGLLTNSKGCPVSVEVFKGSMSNQKTVLDQIRKIENLIGDIVIKTNISRANDEQRRILELLNVELM